jgi:predicted PurR-regulated permease PerM
LYQLAAVVFVLILAALFAYVVEPLVHLAECETSLAGRPRGLSRGAAVAVVYVLLATLAVSSARSMRQRWRSGPWRFSGSSASSRTT